MEPVKLQLRRFDKSEQGVFGEIVDVYGKQIAVTCERPDNGNKPMGCILPGKYRVTQFDSPREGRDFLLHDVVGHTMIEIHSGNTVKDTKGCILVGNVFGQIDFGEYKGVKAVRNSKAALKAMLEAYPDGFELEIVEV